MYEIKKKTRMINGHCIPTYSRQIVRANVLEVEAGTNGYKCGDAGHGSKTFFSINDMCSTAIDVNKVGSGFEVVLYGDSELDTIIEALKFIVRVLEEESQGNE